MRILLASDRLPFPVYDGESLRTNPLASCLAKRHELHFVGFGDEPIAPEARAVFSRIERVPERPARNGRPPLHRIFDPEAWRPHSLALERRIAELLAEVPYDAVWVPTVEIVPYFALHHRVPLFVDVIDDAVLPHLRDLRCARRPLAAARALHQAIVSFRYERSFLSAAGALAVVSETDAAILRRIVSGPRTFVIPNGVDAERFQPLGTPKRHPSILFEGTMSFEPNIDAVRYFHADIFPLVKRELPETTFLVVGRQPTPEVTALAGPDTIVTGSVDDVRPYYDQATVFACSMRRGAGIKNKILQAWAMGTPVVATSAATGGLKVERGLNLVVEDEPAAIARELVRLLRDGEARARMAKAGRETVLAHYSWSSKAEELEAAFAEAIARQR